jgi:protein involved in polysaccharide export with SLBB domain
MLRLLIILLLVLLGGAPLGAQTALVTLRPGDTFEMRLGAVPVELAQEFNTSYSVSQEGTVNIPLIGQTRVGGLTPPQIEKAIQNKLIADKLFTHPSVNIIPTPNSRFISVGGGVRAPQRLAWTNDLTLRSAVDLAGGYSDWGSPKGIRLIRNGQQTVYDARKFDKDPTLDPKLLPGDQIIVPQ